MSRNFRNRCSTGLRAEIPRGYFEVGVFHPKHEVNIGTLMRSSWQLGASGIFTIGRRYKRQNSDTVNILDKLPISEFKTFEEFYSHGIPRGCRIIAIEQGGTPLSTFSHPLLGIYLLGAEDHGLPKNVVDQCHEVVSLESVRTNSFNVAVSGSIVMYHRFLQYGRITETNKETKYANDYRNRKTI